MRPTRRAALVAAPALVLAVSAVQAAQPDAELIRLCAEFNDFYDRCGDLPDDVALGEDCPEWQALQAIEGRIKAIHATTLPGLVAKATVAYRWAKQPDGSLDFSEAFVGNWPGLVVQDLLQMAGEAA